MRKLAIDLTYSPTGGSLAQIIEIIKNLDSYSFEKILFYTTIDNIALFKGINNNKLILRSVPFSNKSIIIRTLWAQLILPIRLIFDDIDLLFCPGNISPIINSRKKVQWIGTVGPFEKKFISSFGLKQKIILYVTKYLMIFSSLTSDLVIFESNYTKNLFVQKYKQKTIKSAVLHIGNDNFFHPIKTSESEMHSKIGSNDFILTVSHLYPYKNLELLLESYSYLNLLNQNIDLVIAGSISDKVYFNKLNLLLDKYGIKDQVFFLGRLDKKVLRELYSKCRIFVFTSPFENFAYTLVEAMSCSAPIISTNTTAMPETCGDAALYFSPDSMEELSNCILNFMTDEKNRLMHKKKSITKSSEYDIYSVVSKKTNQLLENLF